MIFVIIVIGVPLLVILSFILLYKVSNKAFLKFMNPTAATLLSIFVAFAILFGDHIVKEIHFKHLCETHPIDKVYDQEAYDKYKKEEKNKRIVDLKGKELEQFLKKHPMIDKNASNYIFDNQNNYIKIVNKKHYDKKNNKTYIKC